MWRKYLNVYLQNDWYQGRWRFQLETQNFDTASQFPTKKNASQIADDNSFTFFYWSLVEEIRANRSFKKVKLSSAICDAFFL